jgi:hypothetical protein
MVCALRCADFFCLMHRSQDGLGWYLVREKDILVIQVKAWFVPERNGKDCVATMRVCISRPDKIRCGLGEQEKTSMEWTEWGTSLTAQWG